MVVYIVNHMEAASNHRPGGTGEQIETKTMSLNNLKIQNADYDLETGFFWIELDNNKILQCCLKSHGNVQEGEEVYFSAQIETDNNGFNDGMFLDVNEWAIEKYGEEEVQEFIIELARANGMQIVS